MYNSFPVNRGIFEHWIYNDAEYLKTWITMLGRARYKYEPKDELYMAQKFTLNRGEFIFGRPTWARDLSMTESRLRGLIKKMVANNMIEIVCTFNKFTIYRIVNYEKYNQPKNQHNVQQSSEKSQCFLDLDDQHNYQQIDLQVDSDTPTNNMQNTNNKEREEKSRNVNKDSSKQQKGFDQIIETYTDNIELRGALFDFIKMRKCKKKPLTDYALELILKELHDLGSTDDVKIKILNNSIKHCWSRLYAITSQPQVKSNIIDFAKAKKFEVEENRINRYLEQNQILVNKIIAKAEGRNDI